MKLFFIDLFYQLSFEFTTMLEGFRLSMAKRKANKLHKLRRKRFHVVPVSGNKLIVVNDIFIDSYNRKISKIDGGKKITIKVLLDTALYSTPIGGVDIKIIKNDTENKKK